MSCYFSDGRRVLRLDLLRVVSRVGVFRDELARQIVENANNFARLSVQSHGEKPKFDIDQRFL